MISIGNRTFSDIKEWERCFRVLKREFSPQWQKSLHDAGDIAHKYFDRNFAKSGAEFGKPWKALAKATQVDRRRRGYRPAGPILVRRGWLRASVASKTSANVKRKVTNQGIVILSTLKTKTGLNMVALHQKGGKHLPARKIYKEGNPPWVNQKCWDEIHLRLLGMFIELQRRIR